VDILRKLLKKAMKFFYKPSIYRHSKVFFVVFIQFWRPETRKPSPATVRAPQIS